MATFVLGSAEMAAQGTFKQLKGLSEEYEALKKQNSRQEEFISFYEAIRTYEARYVELKNALSRAKDQARYQSSDADIPPVHYRPAGHKGRPNGRGHGEKRAHSGTSSHDSLLGRGRSSPRMAAAGGASAGQRDFEAGCAFPQGKSRADVSRRTVDPLSDPLLQHCLDIHKARSRSLHCSF